MKDYGLDKSELDMINFDYHQQCRGGAPEKLTTVLLKQAAPHLEKHGFFFATGGQVQK